MVDQILESFEYNKYTLGVFIDLSKAFDIVNHSKLLKKLELYGVTDQNHSWIKNYLSNRKQFIQINNEENTEVETITCGVPQGSILVPLLFLLHLNDLKNASNLLDPIKHSLLSLYHSYIHYYINYGIIAWGGTTRTNLKRIYNQQKYAIRTVFSKDRLSHTRELFMQCKGFNVYQVNI